MKAFLKRPECVVALMEQITSASDMQQRHISGVLLRRKLPIHFVKMPASMQTDIKCALLDRLRLEACRPVRLTIAALISSLAQHLVPKDQWSELLPWLLECSHSEKVYLKHLDHSQLIYPFLTPRTLYCLRHARTPPPRIKEGAIASNRRA
jgi:hypothetical protein